VRVLILGGDGMLGHQLRRELGARHEVLATVRRVPEAADAVATGSGIVYGIDVLDFDRVGEVVTRFRPDAVVNAVGVVKQRKEAEDPVVSIETNALLPHRLARLCSAAGARLVHFSTDCVFSGRVGRYRETDPPDPEDLYGRSKLLGEVAAPSLTLRSSIIGLEKRRQHGLVEWFLASRGRVRGYRRAIYSGLTTLEMSRLVARLLDRHPGLAGLWHVASEPIDKYTLLVRLARALDRRDVAIEPVDEPVCDRSLCGDGFAGATGYRAPSWDAMLGELAAAVRERKG
jgi:dTDP-4-dehydrorhamnose reductase